MDNQGGVAMTEETSGRPESGPVGTGSPAPQPPSPDDLEGRESLEVTVAGVPTDDFKMTTQLKDISVATSISPSSPYPVFTHTMADVTTQTTRLQEPVGKARRVSWSPSISSDEPVCRICHDVVDERGKTKLVSPCECRGSAQFIHKKCLQKWTSVKGDTTCEICNTGYKTKYIHFTQKLLTRRVMCMGSAASLPLLIIIIVGFFLLGEQLSIGTYDREPDHPVDHNSDHVAGGAGADRGWDSSRIMVAVCMISAATLGIFLLCCFSVWAARVQPHRIDGALVDGGFFGYSERDVEFVGAGGSGRGSLGGNASPLRTAQSQRQPLSASPSSPSRSASSSPSPSLSSSPSPSPSTPQGRVPIHVHLF